MGWGMNETKPLTNLLLCGGTASAFRAHYVKSFDAEVGKKSQRWQHQTGLEGEHRDLAKVFLRVHATVAEHTSETTFLVSNSEESRRHVL